MVVRPWGNGKTAYDLCIALLNNGLLAKQTHEHIIRFAPPLIIQANEVNQCCDIIEKTIFETIA
jgi:ornithine--oxo-acid transaminase